MKHSENKIYANSGNKDVINLIEGTGKIILDVGCGSGSIARVLNSQGNIVDGITISKSELNEASAVLRNGHIYNLEDGLPESIETNSYDYVICSHVLEHIAYPEKLLMAIRKVLKPGGYLIVALPNVFYYPYRLQLMRGEFKSEETGVWDYTHLRWYSFNSGKELLNKNGFETDVATVTGDFPFSSVLKYVLPPSTRQVLYSGLTAISKGFFGYQLLYRVRNSK